MRLRLIFLGFGAAALWSQLVLFREFHLLASGHELNFALFMGVWLLSVAAGAALAAPGLDRRSPRYLRAALTLCVWALALMVPAQMGVIRHWRLWSGAPVGVPMDGMALVPALLAGVMPAGWAIGFAFPTGVRLALFTDAQGVGRLYAAEAVGALAAGVLFTYVAVGRWAPVQMVLGLAAGLIGLSALIPSSRWVAPFRWAVGLACLIAALWPGVWLRWEEGWTLARWRGLGVVAAPGDGNGAIAPPVTRDTPYQNLTLTRRDRQYTLWSNGEPMAVFPDPLAAAAAAPPDSDDRRQSGR